MGRLIRSALPAEPHRRGSSLDDVSLVMPMAKQVRRSSLYFVALVVGLTGQAAADVSLHQSDVGLHEGGVSLHMVDVN